MSIARSKLQISQKKFLRCLTLATAIIVLLGVMIEILAITSVSGPKFWWKIFDLDTEGNIPTIYSALLIFTAAVLAYLIAVNLNKNKSVLVLFWYFSAFFLAVMGLDELLGFHNKAALLVSESFKEISIFRFRWVVPAIIFVILMGLIAWPFLKQLPARTRNLLLLSAAIYLSGALGMEMFGAAVSARDGALIPIIYAIGIVLEESLEMIGIVVLLATLLDYIASEFDQQLVWRKYILKFD